ncbi:DNA-binding protein [Beauveria brongniartii RCEF 3172]|uniref:DNA-binding protein n=1 Tax=Beauveria brongniartii RCEF 3172 TaxID=1081107 RepID=A0A167HUS9_9HYPO|nr:DNA-binding protein [Beauveria brongniartii RCEF 3172]
MERIRKMAAYLWNFRYLPMKYRWRLIKLRRLLFPTETPLHLRHSVRFARALRHPPLNSPVLFVLGLLWPFPTWKFAAELPLRPRLIVKNPKPVRLRGDDLHFLRIIPLWSSRDTPERALYRIYEAVCAEDGDLIASEIQYFWCKTSWATINITDPECKDQEQYAVMAATAEAIVECFNIITGG